MSTIGQNILEGLQEALTIMEGTATEGTYTVCKYPVCAAPSMVDVRAIRQRMGLSQAGFAASFGLSLHALRNWEQGKRQPDPAARAYLRVIEVAPQVVIQALQA